MGVSPTPPSVELPAGALAPVVAVAYSGGRDSTALLHATWSAAQAGQTRVVALHVHHGLSPQADAWLAHAKAQCAQWAAQGAPLVFQCERLSAQPPKGDSVEAWARGQRYDALGRMARAAGAQRVLLAHHRRDQAETFLLQALRGAGMAGLSAMPEQYQDLDGLQWWRPWLDTPREAIEAYGEHHRLTFIDDDSNAQSRFARNRLRLNVWPAWTAAFPGAEAALVQSAQRAQEAQACLSELAQIDLAQAAPQGPLVLAVWAQFSAPRRSNALRAWLYRQPGLPVTRSLMTRLMQELTRSPEPAQWPVGTGELRRYLGSLIYAEHRPQAIDSGITVAAESLVIDAPGLIELPHWGGCLEVFPVVSGGVAWVRGMVLALRPRLGGEQFQAGHHQPPRALKKQFQAARVPAWHRRGPLIYRGDTLAFVPGLGLDARVLATGGAQVGFRWHAAPGETASDSIGGWLAQHR